MNESIKLPPLPSPFGIVDPDGTEGLMQYATKNLQDYAKAYARTAIEADRQTNKNLTHYMPEVIAALKATGCNESLVEDIEKSMRGECNRQARQGNHTQDIPKGSGDPVWQCAMAHRMLTQAGVPQQDSECALSIVGRIAALLGMNGLRLEGNLGGPLKCVSDRQARGEPVVQALNPITAYIMLDDSGERPVFCVMAAYRTKEEAKAVNRFASGETTLQIPEGYALVPIEPTEEMKDAADFRSERYGHIATNKYKAMIKAAPQPKQQVSESVTWVLSQQQVLALAQELVEGAKAMGGADDDGYECDVRLTVKMPGKVIDDDGKPNDHPMLGILLDEYPEEGFYPIDPYNCEPVKSDLCDVSYQKVKTMEKDNDPLIPLSKVIMIFNLMQSSLLTPNTEEGWKAALEPYIYAYVKKPKKTPKGKKL